MTIEYEIFDFPQGNVGKQLFYAAGQAYDGGLTSGGARQLSPEPGGFSFLEIEPTWIVNESDDPFMSWFFSAATNGTIFRIPLTVTPQLVPTAAFFNADTSYATVLWDNDQPWDNDEPWLISDLGPSVVGSFNAGVSEIVVSMGVYDNIFKRGHVIGHGDVSYMINRITYVGSVATIKISPPLRHALINGEQLKFRPFFLGICTNSENVRVTYDAENKGKIKPNKIVFSEVIID